MCDEKKIDELLKTAVLNELEGVEFVQSFDYATLCREYNGIGPEWAGAKVRDKVTKYLAVFEPAALIHDMRYAHADGTMLAWQMANREFFTNCTILADATYPWYSWRRYIARAAAHALYDAISTVGGLAAYAKARKENT